MNVPLLDLKTETGALAPWRDIWQRKNLLLLLAEPDCQACLSVLEGWRPHLAEERAIAVAIFPEAPKVRPEGAIILIDPEERMASALGVPQGTAIAADRYFSIQAIEPIHELGAETVSKDTIQWIDLAERRCDECGVPTW